MNNPSHQLDQITLAQFAFKNAVMRNVCSRIAAKACIGQTFYVDEIDFADIADPDKNCIGCSFKLLKKLRIVKNTGNFRKSTTKDANGRVIFEYVVDSLSMARTFLKQNGATVPARETQPNLL
jgi:hypothetical protein